MKRIFSVIGLGLLIFPLLRHRSLNQRLEDSESVSSAVATLLGLQGGLMIGCLGLMTLGFVVDAGAGYKKPVVLVAMLIAGILWTAFYPSGWMLGIPLILYSLWHRLGFSTGTKQ